MIYKVKEEDLIGDIKDIPIEIVQKMVEHQFNQTGKCNVEVFQRYRTSGNGFDCSESPEGFRFWFDVLNHKKFNIFYERYPKNIYPKVMWVSGSPDFKNKVKRVVFMEKCGGYIAWLNAETLEGAKEVKTTQFWNYAKDVEKRYTIQELCKIAGLDINEIKIILSE